MANTMGMVVVISCLRLKSKTDLRQKDHIDSVENKASSARLGTGQRLSHSSRTGSPSHSRCDIGILHRISLDISCGHSVTKGILALAELAEVSPEMPADQIAKLGHHTKVLTLEFRNGTKRCVRQKYVETFIYCDVCEARNEGNARQYAIHVFVSGEIQKFEVCDSEEQGEQKRGATERADVEGEILDASEAADRREDVGRTGDECHQIDYTGARPQPARRCLSLDEPVSNEKCVPSEGGDAEHEFVKGFQKDHTIQNGFYPTNAQDRKI
ncbi:hypothetical protein C8R45DRAFT_928958 [Mycena sanguinolenta]|nr:hypothetical protein C8R45DRAFT_928958 [Mycena sanguinolenta]